MEFADNLNDYILASDKVPQSFAKVLIGVDWGDAGSAHSFTATGITTGFKDVIVLRTEKHDARDLTPTDVENKVVAFVQKAIEDFGPVAGTFCDHINTFINGCRVALRKAGK